MGFLDYESINKVMQGLIESSNTHIKDVFIGCKALAITFLLINWMKEIMERRLDPENDKVKLPVSIKSLLFGCFYIFMIISWTEITETLDNLLASYENTISPESEQNSAAIFAEFEKQFDIEKAKEQIVKQKDNSIIGLLSDIENTLLDAMNNVFYSIIFYIVKALAWLVNTIAYPLYLIERAFLLFVMNIIAPFLIALAAFDKFRDLVYKWIKTYCAVFLTGLAFLYANWLCEAHFKGLYNNFIESIANGSAGKSAFGIDFNYRDRHLVEVCIFTIIALSKLKLYNASITILNKMFS